MRPLILVLCAVPALALGACGDDDDSMSSAAPAAKDAVTVDIADFKFAPPTVTVKAGGSVRWTNSDSAAHTATRSTGAGPFDTDNLDKGQSKKIAFPEPGTYAYVCALHPFMKGSVTVE